MNTSTSPPSIQQRQQQHQHRSQSQSQLNGNIYENGFAPIPSLSSVSPPSSSIKQARVDSSNRFGYDGAFHPHPPYSSAPDSSSSSGSGSGSLPLHRRVKVDGLSGRFLRAIVSALAGMNHGSAHLLIDLSHVAPSGQFDPKGLAAMMTAIGKLFGLSCDMVVCHADTTTADFSCAPQPQLSHQHQHQQTHTRSSGGSFSVPNGSIGFNRHGTPAPSPEFGPAMSNAFRSNLPPPTLPIPLPPPAVPATAGRSSSVRSSDDELGIEIGGGNGGSSSSNSSSSNSSSRASENDGQLNVDDDLSRSDRCLIPSPPPLSSHIHAPRRQPSHEHTDAILEAPYRDTHRPEASTLLPYDYTTNHHHPSAFTYHSHPTAPSHLTLRDTFSPASPSPDFLGSQSRGPIFANIFIAHHLHNASKEVQDVLLQALKLKQISIDGLPINLPAIHLCIATHSQTVRHPRSGLSHRLMDEFVMDIMADSVFFQAFERFLILAPQMPPSLAPHLPIPWQSIRQHVNEDESSAGIYMSPQMLQYVRDISTALRQHGRVAFGPTPQGVQTFIHAAK